MTQVIGLKASYIKKLQGSIANKLNTKGRNKIKNTKVYKIKKW